VTPATLKAWLLAQALILDGHGYPIPRPSKAVDVIVTAAMSTGAPYLFAAYLDVLAAHESGYKPSLAGDCPKMKPGSLLCTREKGAKACGAFQGLCSALPANATPSDQANLAVRDLMRAIDGCPNHPLWQYAAGHCARSHVADLYEADVSRELAVPVPDEVAVQP
jgi:hypothetical protein